MFGGAEKRCGPKGRRKKCASISLAKQQRGPAESPSRSCLKKMKYNKTRSGGVRDVTPIKPRAMVFPCFTTFEVNSFVRLPPAPL